jgi:hypothetical protein
MYLHVDKFDFFSFDLTLVGEMPANYFVHLFLHTQSCSCIVICNCFMKLVENCDQFHFDNDLELFLQFLIMRKLVETIKRKKYTMHGVLSVLCD